MSIFDLLWLFLIFSSLQPIIRQRLLEAQRLRAFRRLEERRHSRVIGLIHRQETMSFLGIPLARYIDIEDSEHLLRAISLTDKAVPIDLVLHTPGGLVLAAEQIAFALKRHPAKVTVFVPHYAMSGGTLISLAADEIVMADNAVLGPVDPQLGQYAAASILAALEAPGERDDETLILGDMSRKAIVQVESFVGRMLEKSVGAQRAREVARLLATGTWTHDHPLQREELQLLGLPVRVGVGDEERELLDLYPQPRGREAAVEYVPAAPARDQQRQ
jgi:ClpP class serine protease